MKKPIQTPPAKATGIVEPTNTTTIVVITVAVMAVALVFGIVLISIFGPPESQKENIRTLVSAVSAVLVPLVGYLLAKKVDAVHVQLNERMSKYLDLTAVSSHAEGKLAERDRAHQQMVDAAAAGGLAEAAAKTVNEVAKAADAAEVVAEAVVQERQP